MATARDITTSTLVAMGDLRKTYGTLEEMFNGISKQSLVSESMIRKLYYGSRANPSVDVLDKVTTAVNLLLERR